MRHFNHLMVSMMLFTITACGTWQSPAADNTPYAWRSNPHDPFIAAQSIPRLPSPPYSKVALTDAEKDVTPLGTLTAQDCAGYQLLGLRDGLPAGTSADRQHLMAIWEYEVRRTGGNRSSYIQRLRTRNTQPQGGELEAELENCSEQLVAHYENAGAPLASWGDHPIVRAMNAEAGGAK